MMPYHREEEREREKCRGVNEWDFKFACGKRERMSGKKDMETERMS